MDACFKSMEGELADFGEEMIDIGVRRGRGFSTEGQAGGQRYGGFTTKDSEGEP